MKIGYPEIDSWVETMQRRGVLVFWEGWNLVLAKPNRAAFFKRDGRFINGKWHRTFVVTPDELGEWRIPRQYAT